MTVAKYHHLIPRTYMRAWKHNKNSLYVIEKSNRNIYTRPQTERNLNRIFGENGYHRILPGMPICTLEDCKKLFASVKDYDIKINGEIIKDPVELNNKWRDFSEWEIFRKDGSTVSKPKIKEAIKKVVINDIEEQWS